MRSNAQLLIKRGFWCNWEVDSNSVRSEYCLKKKRSLLLNGGRKGVTELVDCDSYGNGVIVVLQ